MKNPYFFTHAPLDRAAHLRRDHVWLDSARREPSARFLPVWGDRTLMRTADPVHLVSWDASQAEPYIASGGQCVFLGLAPDNAGSWWALDVSALSESDAAVLAPNAEFTDLRVTGPLLGSDEAALAAYARALIVWNGRQGFCSRCGHAARPAEAGHVRRCTNPDCEAIHFPRTDPAVIVLVESRIDGQDVCLLGRHPKLPDTMYTTLAGFGEPGESLEEVVTREIFEESGIRVADVTYVGSQPWPFPSSLMIGFSARALNLDISVDPAELDDARWFTREQLRNRRELGVTLPRRISIARHLIEGWLNAG